MDQAQDGGADGDASALRWLRSLCEEGRFVPVDHHGSISGPPDGFDAARFARGQRVAADHLFSLAYAELLSMVLMFAFEDQTAALVATERSDTPAKAYVRYLSTMRRVRSWYDGDLWDPKSEAARNVKVVRSMHRQVDGLLSSLSAADTEAMTLHARAAFAPRASPDSPPGCPVSSADDPLVSSSSPVHHRLGADGRSSPVDAPVGPQCAAAMAARDAFAGTPSYDWATADSEQPPALNQRSMAVTQVAFVGLFILEPGLFGAHGVEEEDLDALVYVWWVLGRVLGIQDRFNACGTTPDDGGVGESCARVCVRVARRRCRAVVRACALPRLARATARWQLMAAALCDGAALAAPGLSLPLALSCLADVVGVLDAEAVGGLQGRAEAVEGVMGARDRAWRVLYRLVLDHAMRYRAGRALHNALFRLSLWVSERVAEHAAERLIHALVRPRPAT